MLENAMDIYLCEIEAGRKKKTHQAYSVALRYFRECVGNKAVKDIGRGDMLKFHIVSQGREESESTSAYNKFESAMTFLKHNDMKPKIGGDVARFDRDDFVIARRAVTLTTPAPSPILET
jgi:hypothetical protein